MALNQHHCADKYVFWTMTVRKESAEWEMEIKRDCERSMTIISMPTVHTRRWHKQSQIHIQSQWNDDCAIRATYISPHSMRCSIPNRWNDKCSLCGAFKTWQMSINCVVVYIKHTRQNEEQCATELLLRAKWLASAIYRWIGAIYISAVCVLHHMSNSLGLCYHYYINVHSQICASRNFNVWTDERISCMIYANAAGWMTGEYSLLWLTVQRPQRSYFIPMIISLAAFAAGRFLSILSLSFVSCINE